MPREAHVPHPEGEIQGRDDWGVYAVDEAALRHGAAPPEEASDASVAYGRFQEPVSMRDRDGWLPDDSPP